MWIKEGVHYEEIRVRPMTLDDSPKNTLLMFIFTEADTYANKAWFTIHHSNVGCAIDRLCDKQMKISYTRLFTSLAILFKNFVHMAQKTIGRSEAAKN